MTNQGNVEGLVVKVPRWDSQSMEIVCGIANAGGGYLLVPSSQKDYLSGKRRAKRSFEAIPDEVLEQLGIECIAAPVMEDNEFFLELEIPSTEEPLGLHGTYWLYNDGVNTRQTYESLMRIWQDEATTPWELKALPYVEEDDLSSDALLSIAGIPLANIEGGGSLSDTVNARIEHLGLAHPRTKKIVNAGAVLLCTNPARFIPGANIHIAAFGTDGKPTGDEDTVVGPLSKQIDEAVRLIMDKYLPSISTTKAFIKKSPPEEAIREAITNALLHKDYSSGVPVRITVSPHQLVIQNVGSIPAGWTEEDLENNHPPSFRNPLIATTARLLGITPAWGEGIEKMRKTSEEKGSDVPRFEISPNRTAVTFALPATRRGASALQFSSNANARPATAYGTTGSPSRGSQRVPFSEKSIAAAHKLDLTQTDEYVFQVLTTNGRATATRIAQVLGVSERTVRRSFKKLREYGFIERIGSDKAGFWNVIE